MHENPKRSLCPGRLARVLLSLTLLATGASAAWADPAQVGSTKIDLAKANSVETLILYDAAAFETPESIVFDRQDNAYITLALTGEIRKIAPDSTETSLAFLPIGAPCGGLPTVALGLAIDFFDQLYVSIAACDPTNNGVWKVDRNNGSLELVANLPAGTVGNGIDVFRGHIYIADTFGGLVWRVPKTGGVAEIWADDPLLQRPPGAVFPGPNGLEAFRGKIYVANSSTGDIVVIPVRLNGSPGEARVAANIPGQGCDEFAFDLFGSIYCTTDPFNTVVRLDPDGGMEVLLTADDLLDGPTSVAFGRRGANRFNLYITNAAFPQFTTSFRPSLMRLRLNVPGAPFAF